MIVIETGAEPSVRSGEGEIGGRRVAGRLFPYGAEAGGGPLRFDSLSRRFPRRRPESSVTAGPASPDPWRAAAAKLPPGPILVGPSSPGEAVRGAYRAAAAGALAAGRSVFLLDPDPEGLPESCEGAVVLCSFSPEGTVAFPSLEAARGRGAVSGVLFPLIPGWTAEPEALEALLSEAAAAGARFATPVVPESDGDSRRSLVEARDATDPSTPEDFFDRIHHREWVPLALEALPDVRRRCAAHGLSPLPPRPAGLHEPAGNAAAAADLEERAELEALPEHRAAALRAAVRWIDECGRDLAAIAREKNFRKVFPFGEELAGVVEALLLRPR